MNTSNVAKVGILTVSDRCSQGICEDKSGKNLHYLLSEKHLFAANIVEREIVSDDVSAITSVLTNWCDQKRLDLILSTGGTGFAPRDVTPEATKQVIEKEAIGLTIAMLKGSLDVTPMAMLSRPVCGIRGTTLIINLPGSVKASQECFEFVLPSIPHAMALLRDDAAQVQKVHEQLQSTCKEHEGCKVGIKPVAFRDRSSPFPLASVNDARSIVQKESANMQREIKTMSYKDSLSYILAEDICARDPLPPFPASVKDGYAVLSSDGMGRRLVLGDAAAGDWPTRQVVQGFCVRVNTGAPIPPGTDAVVQVEDTKLLMEKDDGKVEVEIEILKAPSKDQDIRPIGFDIEKDQIILLQGRKIGSSEIGLLATVGCCSVAVYSKPSVAILSTGNELVDPLESNIRHGQIRDSNKDLLIQLLREHGFDAFDAGVAKDDTKSVLTAFRRALSLADVVISSGGVSMGEKDLVKQVLVDALNGCIHFGRVFMKPGKPTVFSTLDFCGRKKLVFSLPGNPVSAAVTCSLYVIPALRRISGFKKPEHTIMKVQLDHDLKLDPRPEFHRAHLLIQSSSDLPLATSTGCQMSSRLLSMTSANALLVLPPKSEKTAYLRKGDIVDAMIIDSL